jgi:hypothetical protein
VVHWLEAERTYFTALMGGKHPHVGRLGPRAGPRPSAARIPSPEHGLHEGSEDRLSHGELERAANRRRAVFLASSRSGSSSAAADGPSGRLRRDFSIVDRRPRAPCAAA